jgi:hypothetical protein
MYSQAISFTSYLVNICIKAELWNMVNRITNFRKKYLAEPLRKKLAQ